MFHMFFGDGKDPTRPAPNWTVANASYMCSTPTCAPSCAVVCSGDRKVVVLITFRLVLHFPIHALASVWSGNRNCVVFHSVFNCFRSLQPPVYPAGSCNLSFSSVFSTLLGKRVGRCQLFAGSICISHSVCNCFVAPCDCSSRA